MSKFFQTIRYRALRLWFAILAFIGYILITSSVFACDASVDATPDSRCVITHFQNRRGVWFELTLADEMRYRYESHPGLKLQVENYETAVKLFQQRVLLDEKVIASYSASEENHKDIEESLRNENTKLREMVPNPLTKPLLLFGGLAVGALVSAVIIATISN